MAVNKLLILENNATHEHSPSERIELDVEVKLAIC